MEPFDLSVTCGRCGKGAPFARRVERRGADFHTFHACSACGLEFSLPRPGLTALLEGWDPVMRQFVPAHLRRPAPPPAQGPVPFADARRPRVHDAAELERALEPGAGQRLLQLHLEGPGITAALVERVASRGDLSELKALSLKATACGDAALAQLAARPLLRTVRLLVLDCAGVTAAGLEALAAAPLPRGLVTLSLANTRDDGRETRNRVDDAALAALAAAHALPLLESLDISHNPATAVGIAALEGAPGLGVLREVTAWGTGLTRESVAGLGALRFRLFTDFDPRSINHADG